MLKVLGVFTDALTMRIGGDILLQSQLVELPADLMQLQQRFNEKMLKATIAEQSVEAANEAIAGIDVQA